MELKHYLSFERETIEIDEPIGYDNLKMSMSRHDFHGIGAEFSEETLEFYGEAAEVIKSCYDEDIDYVVKYIIKADGETFYEGVVDLSTVSIKYGDYYSVSAKVGEIGVKTIFNNRIDTEVDLNEPKTIDGEEVETPTWQKLHIPIKHLIYTSKSTQNKDNQLKILSESSNLNEVLWSIADKYYSFPIGDWKIVEFGNIGDVKSYLSTNVDNLSTLYTATSDHIEKYGSNTRLNIDIYVKAKLRADISNQLMAFDSNTGWYSFPINEGTEVKFEFQLVARNTSGKTINGDKIINSFEIGSDKSCECTLNLTGELNAEEGIKYYMIIRQTTFTQYNVFLGASFDFTLLPSSYIQMTMYDTLEGDDVKTDMLLVHDALNIVAQATSENEISVKSNWYQAPESHWNAGSMGGGALKALTNGYKIRGLFTDNDNERNMPLSFKDLISNLNALDCIGWGFTNEDGQSFVRVERWEWFYKDNTILTLDNAAEVQIDVNADRIFSELQIGYKKYATNDQYNSIDSPHGTRTFTNAIKAVSKELKQECEFIADNYAIEETRRARTQKNETEESTYDENIFVFELSKEYNYQIAKSAFNVQGIGRPSELINAMLTPRHMAARWRDFIFATNNISPFRFTAGEINYKADFSVYATGSYDGIIITNYLQSFAEKQPQAEDDPITYQHAKFKSEKITFSYPLTLDQYRKVKADPYGIISVNGIQGWILNFKYSFADGMADFTLIAKNQ